jgi:hypothetical protein
VDTIRSRGISVVIVDPFVSSHAVNENDYGAIDCVAETWGRVTEMTGAAVHLVHHVRKTGGNEVTVEDSRDANALLAAARVARVLNVMAKEEGEQANVESPRTHFQLMNGKANLAPPPDGASWFRLASVPLFNGPRGSEGDAVGVVEPWTWPNPRQRDGHRPTGGSDRRGCHPVAGECPSPRLGGQADRQRPRARPQTTG